MLFEDWSLTEALAHFKAGGGKAAYMGNLKSHLPIEVNQECKNNDIIFLLLSANSAHLTQSWHISVFDPTNERWS